MFMWWLCWAEPEKKKQTSACAKRVCNWRKKRGNLLVYIIFEEQPTTTTTNKETSNINASQLWILPKIKRKKFVFFCSEKKNQLKLLRFLCDLLRLKRIYCDWIEIYKKKLWSFESEKNRKKERKKSWK